LVIAFNYLKLIGKDVLPGLQVGMLSTQCIVWAACNTV